ncbi:MAG: hypothetical protein QF595_10140 [Dehalococcoidia bacterium]|jgi:hypothetical protein|nr:hypothetical protein [Dehalococcoidia bacterium]
MIKPARWSNAFPQTNVNVADSFIVNIYELACHGFFLVKKYRYATHNHPCRIPITSERDLQVKNKPDKQLYIPPTAC